MKEYYIVWNQTNYGDGFEFFGVHRRWESALRQYRKVVKNRYGRCPRAYDDIIDFLAENENYDDDLRITYFKENDG